MVSAYPLISRKLTASLKPENALRVLFDLGRRSHSCSDSAGPSDQDEGLRIWTRMAGTCVSQARRATRAQRLRLLARSGPVLAACPSDGGFTLAGHLPVSRHQMMFENRKAPRIERKKWLIQRILMTRHTRLTPGFTS
jgi:hypothetical protein